MIRQFLDDLASIPDHLQALAIIITGATMTVFKQHETGQALIAAGLAMWRGQAK